MALIMITLKMQNDDVSFRKHASNLTRIHDVIITDVIMHYYDDDVRDERSFVADVHDDDVCC